MAQRHGTTFPESNRWGYLDFKLPVDQALVEGSHVRLTHMKQCAQSLLDLCCRLKDLAGAATPPAKVVASIAIPGMFGSRVTIFWDEDYYRSFFTRNGPYQTWSPLPAEPGIAQKWELNSHGLPEICYQEILVDGEDRFEGKIWFFGDIPSLP